MGYYELAYTPGEIDQRLGLLGNGAKWHILLQNTSANKDFSVGDFLVNNSDTRIQVGTNNVRINPGNICIVATVTQTGAFTAGDVLSPIILPASKETFGTSVYSQDMNPNDFIRLTGAGTQYIYLSTKFRTGHEHPIGMRLTFVAEGTGAKYFVGSGSEIHSLNNIKRISGQGGLVTAYYLEPNHWYIGGNLG